MAHTNARMPGKHCKWGCCAFGDVIDHRDAYMKEELALADEELRVFPNELEPDPNWDGAEDWRDLGDVERVTFIPAPHDSDHPWYKDE